MPFIQTDSVRTDLALEAHETVYARDQRSLPGVDTLTRSTPNSNVTKVNITSPEGSIRLNKPIGTYITIETPKLRRSGHAVANEVAEILTEELSSLADLSDDSSILVVGLGNWNATPDALGPRIVDSLMVTRHLFEYAPPELRGGLRPVSALAPGVLGITGIETEEIVRGVVGHIHPDLVIAVDALAARSLYRVGTTIQLSDSGIHPGSGVGNKRIGLTQESLGTRVVAVGVPTVIHASTLAKDALDRFSDTLIKENAISPQSLQAALPKKRQDEIFDELLPDQWQDLFVTPKEIDALIIEVSNIIAGSLNAVLHPRVSAGEGGHYLQ